MDAAEQPQGCQNCARPLTRRNGHGFTTFLDRPLCANWRACHRRRLGYAAPPRLLPPRLRLTTFRRHSTDKVTFRYVTIDGAQRCVSL